MKFFTLPAILLFAVLPAFADSIQIDSFAPGPNGELVSVSLVPGVDQLLLGIRADPQTFLHFLETFTGPGVFTWTLSVANLQQPQVLHAEAVCPPGETCGGGFGFFVPMTFHPVAGQLTVQFNDEIAIYDFHYISRATVPEPTTLLLLGTGLVGVVWRKRRRERRI